MGAMVLIRRRKKSEHSEGYWPGYVDALTNVVLNLLFLVAILAAGVFSLGMQVSRHSLNQGADVGRGISTPQSEIAVDTVSFWRSKVTNQSKVNPTQKDLPEVEVTVSARSDQGLGRVVLEGERNTGDRRVLSLAFKADAIQISEADQKTLVTDLTQRLHPGTTSRVTVWAVSDGDPVRRRAAYLRVLATREVLLAAGVSPDAVAVRLVTGVNSGAEGQTVYVLVH